MTSTLTPPKPAAFTISGATNYSGFTRTFLYENRDLLDWIKAGRRSLITRASIDRLLLQLLQQTQDRARLRASSKAAQTKPAQPGGGQ
jgi:hypothetical protein